MKQQRGIALILMAVIMVQLALALLWLGAGHHQHMHARLVQDERNAARLQHIETIFDDLAAEIISNPSAHEGKGVVVNGQRTLGEQRYSYDVEASTCTHLIKTTTRCWTLSVQAGGSGFRRSRLLHVPLSHCTAPYWYLAEAA
jgi:hypothetical protein